MRDAWCCTYSRAASSGAGLHAYALALDPQQVAQLVPELAERCCRYLAQSFDLLGSGWRTVTHGAASNGFAGHRYPPCSIRTDACGAWLAGQVSRPNLARARAVWSLLHPEYRAVDWHLDFRSGYRWSPLRWYRAVPYGHLPGVDVKIPWELARMQHLPQLALAFGCAPPGLRDSWRRNDGRTWAPFARLPLTVVQRLKSVGRLQRRLWRAAIHHVVPLSDGALVVFGYRAIYRLDASGGCVGVSPLRGSPPLCLCVDRDIVYYGEYRANRERSPVHVWASRDRGATWTAAIPTGSSTATRR